MRTSLQTVPSGINMFKLLKSDNLIELMKLQEFYGIERMSYRVLVNFNY